MDIRSFFSSKPRQEELIPRQRIQPVVQYRPTLPIPTPPRLSYTISSELRPGQLYTCNQERQINQTTYVNPTKILFNDEFKKQVQELINENPNRCITSLIDGSVDEENIQELIEAQKIIREWFMEKKIISRSPHNYPDHFAALNAIISDLSICQSWEDVFKQFNNSIVDHIRYVRCPEDEDDLDQPKYTCLCGHWCSRKNLAIIQNRESDLHLLIACDCITKTGIVTRSNFHKRASEVSNEIRQQRIKRRIQILNNAITIAYNYKKSIKKFQQFILSYKEKRKKFKSCIRCGICNIEKWKTKNLLCFVCYTNTLHISL